MSNQPEYLTIVEARRRLAERGIRVTRETVRRWAKAGKVGSARLPGGRFLVLAADVDKIAEPVAAAVAS